MEIRILGESDAPAWRQIRLQALEGDPYAFGKSAEDFRATSAETLAERFRETSLLYFNLGAFDGDNLVGTATFMREKNLKERHKGHIYAVYVAPAHRGKKLGRALIAALVEEAKKDPSLEQILLSVAVTQPAAQKLYRSFGFETFGTELRSIKIGCTYIDEHHMVLRVR